MGEGIGSILIGAFCVLCGLGVIFFYANSKRTGVPIYLEKGQSDKPKLEMNAFHAFLASMFFFGIGLGILGPGLGKDFGRYGFVIAVLSFILLIITSIFQTVALDNRHKKELREQGLLPPEKKMPLWANVLIFAALIGLFYFLYHMTQQREMLMQSVVNEFVEHTRAGDYEAAWQLYNPEIREKLTLETFRRNAARTSLSEVSDLEMVHFNAPYKMSPGQAEFEGIDAQGNKQRFSVTFKVHGNAWQKLTDPLVYVRRFSHDTPKIYNGVQQFIKDLKDGNLKRAKELAFIHEYNADGEKQYTRNGKQLQDLAAELGLTSARKLGFFEPVYGEYGRLHMDLLVTPPTGQPYKVRMELGMYPSRPQIAEGLRIYGMERLQE